MPGVAYVQQLDAIIIVVVQRKVGGMRVCHPGGVICFKPRNYSGICVTSPSGVEDLACTY